MTDRTRVLVLLDCPAALRPTLGRLIKALGRRYGVRVKDFAETNVDRIPKGAFQAECAVTGTAS